MAAEPKEDLHRYLRAARQALVWKLDGLSEYDLRRPLVPTGTNLLGLVKHVTGVETGYFGESFGRPFDEPMPWYEPGAEANADMWATSEQSSDDIIGRYQRACAHSDETIESLGLEAEGHVPWWPEDGNPVTLHRVLVHVVAETNRHVGHADLVRELIDGSVGLRSEGRAMASDDPQWWQDYRDRVERAAREAGQRQGAN